MINIAVIGYGTVGSGVVEVIDTNGERIAQRIGDALNVKYVILKICRLWLNSNKGVV